MNLCSALSVVFVGFSMATAAMNDPVPPGNLHPVDSFLYRSQQPNRQNLYYLEQIGVRTVINLRNRFSDRHEIRKTDLVPVHYPINSWKIGYPDLVEVLQIIRRAEKPVLVHCLHGADRTGCIIACYRMVFMNQDKEEAIADFLHPKYGYHDGWFPRMINLLKSLDIEQLRRDVLSAPVE